MEIRSMPLALPEDPSQISPDDRLDAIACMFAEAFRRLPARIIDDPPDSESSQNRLEVPLDSRPDGPAVNEPPRTENRA
jgi:hypothetical protein